MLVGTIEDADHDKNRSARSTNETTTPRMRIRADSSTLERTTTMATTATFSKGSGVLSVIDDSIGNTIVTSRDAAGNILVNGGAVAVLGDRPTVANTGI